MTEILASEKGMSFDDQSKMSLAQQISMNQSQRQQLKRLLKKGIYLQLHQQKILTDEQLSQLLDQFTEETSDRNLK